MSVHTKLLLPPTVIATAGGVQYDGPPASTTWIIKWLAVVNGHTSAVTLSLAYRASGPVNRYVMWLRSIAAGASEQIPVGWVMNPTYDVWAVASVANVMTISLHGTELDGIRA